MQYNLNLNVKEDMDAHSKSLIFDHLLQLQNRDGGWGSALGKQSNPEATAYALMALAQWQDQAAVRGYIKDAVSWLLGRQDVNGAWHYCTEIKQGAWVTAPVLLCLSSLHAYQDVVLRGMEWLLQQRGKRLSFVKTLLYWMSYQRRNGGINPNLPGWSWASGTTSWVEPTAYALLVLNKLRPALERQDAIERIRSGETLLYERMCVDGGWNQGKGMALGKQLLPYPDTTAITLIALQAYQDKRENQMSLSMLNRMIEHQRSGLTLGWAIICRSLYGRDNAALKAQLLEQYRMTRFLGNTKPVALSILALGDPSAYFKV